MVVLRVIVVCVISSFLILEIFGYRQFSKSCYKKNLSFGDMHMVNRLLCSKSSEEMSTEKENEKDFQIWSNPSYAEEEINKWYLDIDRALITVGSKGVAPGQINSLVDLLQQHVHIRVKVASDKLDSHVLSKEMADSELLVGKAELLQVRKRGFMFGTTEKTAAKNTALRNAKMKKVIESKDVSKIKCYNCDCVGHFSSDCPEPKKIESKASAKFSAKSKY
jgi:RNA-binding protein YhbY